MTKLPWLIGGYPLYVWAVGAGAGFFVGFLAGAWWGQRKWRK